MSKRHFETVASMIRDQLWRAGDNAAFSRGIIVTALGLADVFASENPRFDRGLFVMACGIRE